MPRSAMLESKFFRVLCFSGKFHDFMLVLFKSTIYKEVHRVTVDRYEPHGKR